LRGRSSWNAFDNTIKPHPVDQANGTEKARIGTNSQKDKT